MKSNQTGTLERLYRRRVPVNEIISLDIARELIAISKEIGRQVALIISRSGAIEYVIVGDDKSVLIPELKNFPLGKKLLRGIRLIHTHLHGEPLSTDDLNDLLLLRFDLLAALNATGLLPAPVIVQTANLSPPTSSTLPYQVNKAADLAELEADFQSFIANLELDLEKCLPVGKSIDTGSEKAILISVSVNSAQDCMDSLDELSELSRTAGITVLDRFSQRPRHLSPKFLMGEGKMRELIILALQLGASMLVFDQELSPAQIRSISEITELKVIDRSQLILDIFARRATTLDGKVQVELAQLKYLLPRLSGKGVQMSRLMGGIGGRGPGETKLELDRRRIRDRIAKLERELAGLSDGRYQRRQKRIKSGIPIISIVGYTNAGKSTLLNSLTQSDLFTENLLFATLDTSTRRLRFPQEREVIITDTVGFIRSLPKSLIGAFKSTLEELQDADLLLHVVDCANPRFLEQMKQVDNILQELNLADKERVYVFNKSDCLINLKASMPLFLLKVKRTAHQVGAVLLSANDKQTLLPLIDLLQKRFWPDFK